MLETRILETRITDQILIATLSGNKTCALDRATLEAIGQAVDQVNRQKEILGLVITGQQRFFSTGFNLNTFMAFETLEQAGDFISFADKVFVQLFQCDKPVISAMNGHAVAGGLLLAMATDYRLISDHPKTKVGMSEINIGVPLSAVETAIMQFGLDNNRTYRDLIYFGTLISGAQALDKHIVDEIMPPDTLVDRATALIHAWMGTPGTPFIRLKQELKREAALLMQKRLQEKERYENLTFFFDPEVQAALAKVQATME